MAWSGGVQSHVTTFKYTTRSAHPPDPKTPETVPGETKSTLFGELGKGITRDKMNRKHFAAKRLLGNPLQLCLKVAPAANPGSGLARENEALPTSTRRLSEP